MDEHREEFMCKREEVEHIVERSTRDIRDDIKDLRKEHESWQKDIAATIDKRIGEVAVAIVRQEKEGFLKWVGWGGIVGIASVVYFFGGLINQVENLQASVDELKTDQETLNAWVNAGDRFTIEDGNTLRSYIDKQDAAILTQLKEGFAELKIEIRAIK